MENLFLKKRFRNCCFTLNNYTKEEEDAIKLWDCGYIIYGHEIAPTTGTPHLQGYVEWKNQVRGSALKKLNSRISWLSRSEFATAEDNIIYCSKTDKNFFTKGEVKIQGKRTDLDKVVEIIDNPINKIAELYPIQYIKFHNGIEKLKRLKYTDRTEKPNVIWLWGESGAGKTRKAVGSEDDYYIKDNSKWWDGYEQQKVIILDDFSEWWDARDLLRLLDRYKYQGQIKGGYVKINSPTIYITCDSPPEDIYRGKYLKQLMRRIDSVSEVLSQKWAKGNIEL